jgi:multidrug efflux pump subunit AcrA (membrane-fusion protein)
MRDRTLTLIALMGFLPALGCNRKPLPSSTGQPPAGPLVSVVKPEKRPVKRVIEQPGTIQAYEETALFAKLAGFVSRIEDDPQKMSRPASERQIDIGSRVRKDQLLAVLGIPELEQESLQKQALVRQAESEVVQSEKMVEAAKAGVVSAESLVAVADAGIDRAEAQYERWQKELDRIAKLLTGGVGDSQTLDETKNQLRAADAGRKEAHARVASAQAAVKKAMADEAKAVADVAGARAKLEVAKTEVRRLEALLEYTTIKAPFDGVVTRRSINTRDLVSGTEKTPLFTVARIDPVRVVLSVPEADAGLIAIGQDVRLAMHTVQGPEQSGKVVRTSWSLEPGSRTLRVEIDLPNDKGTLRPGTYVHAKLTAELPTAWSVPVAAVGKMGDESIIYLVQGGKGIRMTVELLKGDGQFAQIRRYKRRGSTDWTELTGSELIATPAAGLTDGQAIP